MTRERTAELVALLRLLGEAAAFCSALGEEIPKTLLRLVPQRPTLTEPKRTVHLLVERAAVWMQSMSKLDRWTDYQAQSSGCRAMLELAVDVALVTSEPHLATRMWAFEESAKLKSCDRYRAFALRTKMTNPNVTKMTFGARNEKTVKALRQQHWGSERHPQTWFGKPFEQMAAEPIGVSLRTTRQPMPAGTTNFAGARTAQLSRWSAPQGFRRRSSQHSRARSWASRPGLRWTSLRGRRPFWAWMAKRCAVSFSQRWKQHGSAIALRSTGGEHVR
jgi:hypothetical protein